MKFYCNKNVTQFGFMRSLLRHNVTEFSPKYERGEIAYWTRSCMVGIYLPRQLMDYIGFGPGWTHWAVRAQFKFLGCERPDFNDF